MNRVGPQVQDRERRIEMYVIWKRDYDSREASWVTNRSECACKTPRRGPSYFGTVNCTCCLGWITKGRMDR